MKNLRHILIDGHDYAPQVFTQSLYLHNRKMADIYYSERSKEDLKNVEVISKFDHPKRNELYNLSRMALSDIIGSTEKFNIDWKKLVLKNFHQIENYPHLTCSLTHSKDHSIAVCANNTSIKALGVDLEFQQRAIQNGADRFFINEEDLFSTDEALIKWCIKEACFKALSNLGEPIKLLKEVIIHKNHFFFQNEKEKKNNNFHIIEEDGKIIVIAYCLKNDDINPIHITKIKHV